MSAARRAKHSIAIALLALASLPTTGCGSRKLETGYTYAPLSATPVQRRAYYAGPFSPEARAAMMSEDNDSLSNRSPGSNRTH